MEYTNTDILFASLVGSKINIPRFSAVQNELVKHVLPPIPFLPFRNKDKVFEPDSYESTLDMWTADKPTPINKQFFPLSFSVNDDRSVWYTLPYEPMLSISSKNNIVRRNVAKATHEGTVKERWSRDDYSITITGVLIGSLLTGSVEDCYPIFDFMELKKIMTIDTVVQVQCEPLQLLGINQIVIEDFSFPFTKGENVQAYEIKAFSDFQHQLLIELDD